MKIVCNSCSHSFSLDERTLDTDTVRCPKCSLSCPVVGTQTAEAKGPFSKRFRGRGGNPRIRWPKEF